MSNQLILVADSDPKNLQILKENLEASGLQVITIADGIKAWEEIKRTTPKLILTEINLPGLSGFQLLEKLQADPNTSFIPLIFLTNQREVQQRVRSFQMGAKDYLVKPLHVKEVIAHIRMVSRRLEKRRVNKSNNFSKFSGRLNELKLADLIESFSVERKSGILTLNNGNNRTGQVYFCDGAVINANLGDIRLENAIFQMLPWNKGFFSMVFKEVDIPDEISISNLGLLLEGVKRMEQREKLFRQFPSHKTAFTITPTFKKILEKKKLPDDVQKFISLIDGKRNIKKIIDDSCYDDLKTMERLLRLLQQGFIKPTITPTVTKQPEIDEQIKKEITVEQKPPKIEPPIETDEKPEALPEVLEIKKPIQERIKKRRSEIIIPAKKPTEQPAITEDIKPPVTPTVHQEDETLEPIFNHDEFIKKEQKVKIKKEWDENITIKGPTREKEITVLPRYLNKNQLLVTGTDEDSLDEVMDILTDNKFQTKQLEALNNFPIHHGKIIHDEFNYITLLGIFIEQSFNKIVGALASKLIGNIFIVDCTRDDIWEYTSYLINNIWSNYKIPYVVAITNFHEQNTITLDVVRYKLNLPEHIGLIAWDAVDKTSIKKLLSSVVYPQDYEIKKPADMLEELVEKVTV